MFLEVTFKLKKSRQNEMSYRISQILKFFHDFSLVFQNKNHEEYEVSVSSFAEQQSKMFSLMRKNNEAITTWDLPAVQTHLVLCLGGGLTSLFRG